MITSININIAGADIVMAIFFLTGAFAIWCVTRSQD